MAFDQKASKESVEKTITALKQNGIAAELLSKEQVLERIKDLIPEGSEVLQSTSVTLDDLEVSKEINETGKYMPVKLKLYSEDLSKGQKKKLGAAPQYVVGSVHAVTEDGKVVIASNTGSQLPSYAYGAEFVVWVVGTQKITKNLDEAFDRINTHVLPLESERARKAYGVEGSFVSKLLIVNRELEENRIHILFVDDVIGY